MRRWWFVTLLRLKARLKGAALDLRIAPDVRIGPRVRVAVDRGSRNVLHIGPRGELHEDVLILLRGADVRLGPHCALRRGVVLNVSGTLLLEERNHISYYATLHCGERVVLRPRAGASEFVTVADSRHFPDGPAEWFLDNVETAPIEIGENTWLAPKSTVTMGVTVGARCVVAAHAVVVADVPDDTVVAGVPAKPVRARLP